MAKKIKVTETIGPRFGSTTIRLGSTMIRLSEANLKRVISHLREENSFDVATLETYIELSPAEAKDLLKQLEALVDRKSK